jgi:hypothetical protein
MKDEIEQEAWHFLKDAALCKGEYFATAKIVNKIS